MIPEYLLGVRCSMKVQKAAARNAVCISKEGKHQLYRDIDH
jgi:hypothetical protein